MASLPPLPAGATLIDEPAAPSRPRQRRDPWEVLQGDGFTLNNGYRTQGDQARIRAQGYSPAPNSAHLRGDAVDLGHPRLSRSQMQRRARELLTAEGHNPRMIYHDGHLHVTVPGWGAAPGTPGTQNFGLPPLPAGAELVQRGNMAPGNFNLGAASVPAPPQNDLMGVALAGADIITSLIPGASGSPGDAAAAQNLAAWNGTAAPAPAAGDLPPMPAGAAPASVPQSSLLPSGSVDYSAPLPRRGSGQPFSRPTLVMGQETDPNLAGLNDRSRRLYMGGASAERIAREWRTAGVPASVVDATMPRLRNMVAMGNRNPARRAGVGWQMERVWHERGMPEDAPIPADLPPPTAPADDPNRGELNRQMGLPGTPGAATYGTFVGPNGVEYVANPENVARYPEYAVSDRGQSEENTRLSGVARSMQGAEFRAPPERGFFERSADAASDALREYSPAAALGRLIERNMPNASDYRANDTRTPEQVQADRANRSTASARERRERIALREQGDPANSALDHVADFSGAMVGGSAGDPTTLLMPGRTLVQRMLGTAAIGGGVDATLQTIEMGEGVRDEYSPLQTAISTVAGPVLIGGGRVVGNAARAAGIPVPSGAARDRARAAERAAPVASPEAVSAPLAARAPDRPDMGADAAPAARGEPLPPLPAGARLEQGAHGPIHSDLTGNYLAALERLRTDRTGEVPGAISHPELGPIDLVWGNDDYGLSKIIQRHPEVVDDLPAIVGRLPVTQRPGDTGNNRFVLEDETHRAVIAPDFNGVEQRWLVTAFERKGAPGDQTSRRDPLAPDGVSSGSGARTDIIPPRGAGNAGADAAPSRSRSEAMAREDEMPSVSSEIVGPTAADLQGGRTAGSAVGVPLGDHSPFGRPSAAELADIARGIDPENVLPRPSNRAISLDDHIATHDGRWREVEAPNELAELSMRTLRSSRGQDVRFRGPVDAETFLRMNGGLRDQAGELRHMGVTNNRPRSEVGGEDRLGPILNNRDGMTFDEAGERLFEAGYFPDHASRPSVDEVLDLLAASRRGERTFRPDDLDEVTRFYDAQAQRYAVENARQEGAPLYEDISRPAGPDEREVPTTAYEDLPTITDRVANFNLKNIDSAEDIGRLLQTVEESFGGFDAARRGRMDFGEIQALADELGMTADDLLRRRPGEALNAEQALAARAILAKSSDEVIELAGRARAGADTDRTAFAEALLRHAAIQEQVSGAISEAGRALSSMRAAASSRSVARRIHEITADSMGGVQRLEDIADRILDLQRIGAGPGETTRFAVDAIKPRKRDMLQELWYNSLLSGPQTHVVNTLSNFLTGVSSFPEQAIASALGQGRRAIRAARGKPDDFDRVTAGELGTRLLGYMQGTREGLSSSWNTLRTGEVSDFVTKVESRVQEAIPGRIGKVIRTPSRFLAAEDEFFKAVARRMELTALAARQARKEGLRGEARRERIADLNRNPTDEMVDRAMDFARYMTFQRPLQGIVGEISRWTARAVWPKLFIPFIRTPTNILKYAVERSPAAPILREVRDNIRAGGERRAIATARVMFGTGIGMTVMSLVEQGVITGGGPAWSGAEDMMRADGWQPYSIRVGDTYYSYARLDPLALTLGIAADLHDYTSHMTPRQSEQAGALLIASILRNLENKTWLSGMSDVLSVVQDPQRNLNRVVGRLAGSIAVPSFVNQITRYVDPVQRENRVPSGGRTGWGSMVDAMLGAIENRVPGMSQNLEPRRNVLGEEMRSEGGLGPDAVSPIWTRAARNDPIIRELLNNMIALGRPSRFITVDGVRRELTPREYGSLQELSGRYMREDLTEALAGPDWQDATPDERRRLVAKIKREARAAARADLNIGGADDGEDDTGLGPPLPPGATMPGLPPGASTIPQTGALSALPRPPQNALMAVSR